MASRGALLAPCRECPVSLLVCPVSPCLSNHLSPCWYRDGKVGGPSLWLGFLLHPPLGPCGTRAASCLLGTGRRLKCLLQDMRLHEPSESPPTSPSGLMCQLNSPSCVPCVLWHSTQWSCSSLSSDISCHADRSDRCQTVPTDVTGMTCLAESGM